MSEIVKHIDNLNINVSESGEVSRLNKNILRVYRHQTCRAGYKRVALASNGKRKNHSIHRLVAIAFIPNPLNKPEVNHIDGIKANNHVSNLEWATRSENILHAMTGISGKRPGVPIVMAERDNEIRRLNKEGMSIKELAGKYHISRPRIVNILKGRRR